VRINRFDSNWLQTDLRDSNTDYAIKEVLPEAFASVLTENGDPNFQLFSAIDHDIKYFKKN
jgi:hypothetical protein